MNDRLQQTLSDVLLGAVESASEAKDFVLAELPDVASQALLYHGVINLLGLLLGVVLTYLSYKLIYMSFHNDNLTTEGEASAVAVGIMCGVVGAILSTVTLTLVLKIWLAPKIWLIEYAATLVK